MAKGLNINNVCVVGPGAVGSFMLGALESSGFNLNCITSKHSFDHISKFGINLDSKILGKIHLTPKCFSKIQSHQDLVFICTKFSGLVEFLESTNPDYLKNSIIVPLLNGIEHLDLIKERFPSAILVAGAIQIESKYLSLGNVLQSSDFARIELGLDSNSNFSELHKLVDALKKLPILFVVRSSAKEVLWRKLIRLNALACITTVSGMKIGAILKEDKWKNLLIKCVVEATAVAQSEGVKIPVVDTIKVINNLPSDLGTSMQRDIALGKPSEVEVIPGAILRIARKNLISCSTIEYLYGEIKKL